MSSLIDQPPWADYAGRVAELLRPLASGDGLDEAEVASAEAGLGVRLPRVLRDYYLIAGRRDDLNRAHDLLLPPDEFTVEAGALIFFEENENLKLWGIASENLGHDDPPVVRAENEESLTWHPDHERLSDFFLTLLYWQAVNGAMANAGAAAMDETELPELQRHWPKVELRGTIGDQRIVFHRDGRVLCVAGRAPDLTLHVAGRTRDDFKAIVADLKLWEYFPTDEGDAV